LQAFIVAFQLRQLGVVAQRRQTGLGKGLAGDVSFVATGISATPSSTIAATWQCNSPSNPWPSAQRA
jgi:hypothetical protein